MKLPPTVFLNWVVSEEIQTKKQPVCPAIGASEQILLVEGTVLTIGIAIPAQRPECLMKAPPSWGNPAKPRQVGVDK